MANRAAAFRRFVSERLGQAAGIGAVPEVAPLKPVMETLEPRVLLSADAVDAALRPVVEMTWGGQTHNVVQNEYVIQTAAHVDFSKWAERWNFTRVHNLGFPGVYRFETEATLQQVVNWRIAMKSQIVALSPNYAYQRAQAQVEPNDPLYYFDPREYELFVSTRGNFPQFQGWVQLIADPPSDFPGYVQPHPQGGARLDTTAQNQIIAGFTNYTFDWQVTFNHQVLNPLFPTMDRQEGIIARFGLMIESESHANANEAGYSVILLSSDQKGIELGFHTNSIFGMNDGTEGEGTAMLSRGEEVAFATTGSRIQYEVQIQGEEYILRAVQNGELTEILRGPLRDYSSVQALPGDHPVQRVNRQLPNYVFFGDASRQANVRATIDSFRLQVGTGAQQMWHLKNTGQTVVTPVGFHLHGNPFADIDAERAWGITTGSDEVVVAVMDTGIDLNHPDLIPNLWINPLELEDGMDTDGNGFIDDIYGWNSIEWNSSVQDGNGHGTHVSGTIAAAGNNDLGVVGVSWNSKIMTIKVFRDDGWATTEGITGGINYVTMMARRGVNVAAINASLGGPGFPFVRVQSMAIARAGEAGIMFIAAAGNAAIDLDPMHIFPARYGMNLNNVISVAATGNTDNLAEFSNVGAVSVHVGAPGDWILSTWPLDLAELPQTVPFAFPEGYHMIPGTSMASPIVAGIVALLRTHKPDATVEQIRQAIFDGVDGIPALHGRYSLEAPVVTGGRVNAYKALRSLDLPFVGGDFVTRGNWHGVYGTEGALLAGETSAIPDFVNVKVDQGEAQMIHPHVPMRFPRVPQNLEGTGRVLANWSTPDVMTFDFQFHDDRPHRVTFYMMDYDARRRSQAFEIIDVESGEVIRPRGEVINGRQTTNMAGGQYLTWDLQGHVQVRVTRLSGPDAVVNAIFFDPTPTAPQIFMQQDGQTRGNWRLGYGAVHPHVVGDSGLFPPGVQVELQGVEGRFLRQDSADPRALERPSDLNRRVLAYWESPDQMTIDMNFTDGHTHRVSFYMVDFDRQRRDQRVEVFDAETGVLLDSRRVREFNNGRYVTYELEGHVQVRITNLAGPSAVLSGIFFDQPFNSQARFVGSDVTTLGNWRGPYGSAWPFVIGESTNLPPFLTANIDNVFPYVLHAVGADRRALHRVAMGEHRLVGYWSSPTSMTIDLDFHDEQVHRLSLYAVDYDRRGRVQRIELVDPDTGNVLATHQMDRFQRGQYLTWDVQNRVQIRVTRLAGPNAVISGLFFD
jgi:subtilisin family serine protease